MKKNVENERIYFNGFCESAKKEAVIKACIFAESLNLYELKTQGRLRRVYKEIDLYFEERKALDRPLYYLYVFDLSALFALFEKLKYLHNPEELAKLKFVFSLRKRKQCRGLVYQEDQACLWKDGSL